MNHFSPVIVKQSPVVTTPGKNLTGSPRITRDTIADIHNVIQQWNVFHLEGITILKEMINLLPRDLGSQSEDLMNFSFGVFNLVGKCSEVVKAIGLHHERLKAMAKLHGNEDILFTTLPLQDIVKQTELIYEAFKKELENKKLVCEHIAFVKSVSEAVFFGCLWKHQLNIDSNVTFAMETLLLETGHRKIT